MTSWVMRAGVASPLERPGFRARAAGDTTASVAAPGEAPGPSPGLDFAFAHIRQGRLALREGTCGPGVDVARRDRRRGSFPLPGDGLDLKPSAERTVPPAKTRDPSGAGSQDTDALPIQWVGAQPGARS